MYCISFTPARASTLYIARRNKALNYWTRTGIKRRVSFSIHFADAGMKQNERAGGKKFIRKKAKDDNHFFWWWIFPFFYGERETECRNQRHCVAAGNVQFECFWFLMKKRNSIHGEWGSKMRCECEHASQWRRRVGNTYKEYSLLIQSYEMRNEAFAAAFKGTNPCFHNMPTFHVKSHLQTLKW